MPVTLCELDEGPTTLLEDAQERLQQYILQPRKIRIVVACVSVPIAVQRTTYAPPPEQISHLRQVRIYEFKSNTKLIITKKGMQWIP